MCSKKSKYKNPNINQYKVLFIIINFDFPTRAPISELPSIKSNDHQHDNKARRNTVCPRSLAPLHVVSYNIDWVKNFFDILYAPEVVTHFI